MKDIRIFVASSRELERERNELAFLVLAREEAFAARGLRVRLAKWEYVDPKMTEARTEDRYLDEMYDCDAALVLFRNIAGMYTREELDKALAAEKAGTVRLKAHRILFAEDGAPDSDAAKLRASLPEGSYGVWSGMEELHAEFLSLVDKVAQREGLVEMPDEHARVVSAFIAADDELAADRDAFADTVLNLNDILARRGVRVRLRFYDPALHRTTLDESEMALVLYHTNCNAFGPEQMKEAYDRTKREENPKRLYVFFRDADDARLDPAFVAFKKGFAENLGHFFCAFENADTLKLNFLLSLENVLGDGDSFVKLDGTKVKADELEVGDLTKMPMVANNGGVTELIAQANRVARQFLVQRARCRADPNNDSLYVSLIKLSAQKSQLDKEVAKELGRSFDLAKRMASVSAAEANETLSQARELLDQGRIDEAVALLDGASAEIDDLLGDIGGLEDLMAQKLDALESWIDVELFRADTVLAFAKEPFSARFEKAEKIYMGLLAKARQTLMKHRPRRLASILRQFAKLYGKIRNTEKPVPIYEEALRLLEIMEKQDSNSCKADIAGVCRELGDCERGNDSSSRAEAYYERALALFRDPETGSRSQEASCLSALASLHERDMGESEKCGSEYEEALQIWRALYRKSPREWMGQLASSLSSTAKWHCRNLRVDEGEKLHREALMLRQKLFNDDNQKRAPDIADSLDSLARVYQWKRRHGEASAMYGKAVTVLRKLVVDKPDEYEPTLASVLQRFALLQSWNDNYSEAESMYGESVTIYRRFETAYPGKFADNLSDCLKLLAQVHMDADKLDLATKEMEESLRYARSRYQKSENKYGGSLSAVLHYLGDLYKALGRLDEAESMYKESLSLARCHCKKDGIFIALCLLASAHVSMGKYELADKEFDESISVGRELADQDPVQGKEWLAVALHRKGSLAVKMKFEGEAESAFFEGLSLFRALADAHKGMYDSHVAVALTDIAVLHTNIGRFTEAEAEFAEALQIREELAAKEPAKYNKDLAETLHEQAKMLLGKGDLPKAKAAATRAYDLLKRLSEECPEKFSKDLAETEELVKAIFTSTEVS